MVRASDYTDIMSLKLSPISFRDLRIARRVIPDGSRCQFYDPVRGCLYMDVLEGNFVATLLLEGDDIWMSDSPLEQDSLCNVVKAAWGDVLIGGLGIGLLPTLIAHKPEVNSITVVEIRAEVRRLVWHLVATPNMRIVFGDFIEYVQQTDRRYDVVYFDLWKDLFAPVEKSDAILAASRRCLKDGGVVIYWLQELHDRVRARMAEGPVVGTGLTYEPCLVCSKSPRVDYAGLCMDCADLLGVSEIYMGRS